MATLGCVDDVVRREVEGPFHFGTASVDAGCAVVDEEAVERVREEERLERGVFTGADVAVVDVSVDNTQLVEIAHGREDI